MRDSVRGREMGVFCFKTFASELGPGSADLTFRGVSYLGGMLKLDVLSDWS